MRRNPSHNSDGPSKLKYALKTNLSLDMSETEQTTVVIPLHRPSFGELAFFLGSGVIASIPLALFFETGADFLTGSLPQFYAEVLAIVIFAPFIEEFAKAYPLFYRHGETQKSIFTMGLLTGVGFGIAEFAEYVLILQVPFYIRLPGIFFHAATASVIAYGIATKQSFAFYLVAVFLHSFNNFLAITQVSYFPNAIALVIAIFLSWVLYSRTSEKIIPY
jgi:hypothetical protein